MSDGSLSLSALMTGIGSAVLLVATVFLTSTDVRASSMTSQRHVAANEARPSTIPDLPPIRARAEPGDELAALRAIDTALSETGDGSTYVWGHGNGRLAGAIRITSTFRDREGRICRHLLMTMRLGSFTRHGETIACRDRDGAWNIEG